MSTGIGDKVAALTSAVGISPCEICKKRQEAMNKVDFSKPIAEVYKDLRLAVTDPDLFLASLT